MKKKILRLISSALTCTVIAGGSIACPLTAQAEESYITRYDYITGLFSYDVCNSFFGWDRNFNYPIYTLCIKKGLGDTKIAEVDTYAAELYIGSDNPDISELVYDYNPNIVIAEQDILTPELVEQLDLHMPDGDIQETIERVRKGDLYNGYFERIGKSFGLWRMYNCPRSSFSDIELGSGEFAFEDVMANGSLKDIATRFLFADYTGIASGYSDGSFRPKAYITNEDAAVLVYRMLQNPYFMKDGNSNIAGFELPKPNRELLKSYADGESVSEYARDAVSVLIQLNFITPENNRLNPKAFATTSYVNKIYANVNSFFKTHRIRHYYNLGNDPAETSFINWDRRIKICGRPNDERLKRKVD